MMNGILDPLGSHDNPLNNKPYSDAYKDLAKIWSKFPAYQEAKSIINDIQNNNVILVVSGTGSGKTVLVPKFALHVLGYEGKIAITLPKTIITKSSAEFASKTLDVELGQQVGYQYRNSGKNTFSSNTKLLYMTDGTLVARLLADPSLKEFDIVIIDEAHERKVNIDFLLYLLRETLKMRPEFKLIIMSATINEEIFKNYYQEFAYTSVHIGTKPNYPIESIFLEKELDVRSNEYLKKGIEIIENIIKTTDDGDILFFVTSVNETQTMCDLLEVDDKPQEVCVSVYSGMDPNDQMIAIDKNYYRKILHKNRKIIVATNVAESSLTIDGIKYVIDSGLELRSSFNINLGINVLEKTMISNAQARQRMGRTGRTEPGICYHLYTEHMMNETMDKFPLPSIRNEFLYSEILKLMGTKEEQNVTSIKTMLNQFIEPPNAKIVDMSIDLLKKLNLINETSEMLTQYGLLIVEMQADPIEGLCMIMGYKLMCFKEVISIIAMINAIKGSMSELFNLPDDILDGNDEENDDRIKRLQNKFNKAVSQFDNKYGDHVALLTIFKEYKKLKNDDHKLNNWLYKHFLRRSILEKAEVSYIKLKRYMSYFQSDLYKNLDLMTIDVDSSKLINRVMASLLYGYKYNHLIIKKMKIYVPDRPQLDNVKLETYSFVDLKNHTKQEDYFYHILFGQERQVKAKIVTKISKTSLDIMLKTSSKQSGGNGNDHKIIYDISAYEFFQNLSKSKEFRNDLIQKFKDSKYENVLWEFPPYSSSTKNNKAEFVIIGSAIFPPSNPQAFADQFNETNEINKSVVVFDNISGDCKLISPVPDIMNDKYMGHIMSQIKYGNTDTTHQLLKTLGDIVSAYNNDKPLYVSTHGYGVPWLHLRLCDKPKYYHQKEYM